MAYNLPDFEKWQEFLRNKGYTNYWKDLNAKNYGVAQNRNRLDKKQKEIRMKQKSKL